jgi:hypothetical protein
LCLKPFHESKAPPLVALWSPEIGLFLKPFHEPFGGVLAVASAIESSAADDAAADLLELPAETPGGGHFAVAS